MNHIEYIGLFLVFIYTIFTIYYDKGKLMKLKSLLGNNLLMLNLFLILSFFAVSEYLYLNNKHYCKYKHLKNTVIKSLVGVIIAFYAYLDMLLAPFWTIFLISYIFPEAA